MLCSLFYFFITDLSPDLLSTPFDSRDVLCPVMSVISLWSGKMISNQGFTEYKVVKKRYSAYLNRETGRLRRFQFCEMRNGRATAIEAAVVLNGA